MQNGDYILVQDALSDEILMSGTISKITDNPKGYSVDGIIFVNPNSSKLIINKVYSLFKTNICYKDKITEDRYKIIKHNNIDNTFEYDFFMWNEIEPEVKETCELLNSLRFVETYSSCSGHGKIPSYIDFHILDYNKFFDFLVFLNENDIYSYTSKHQEIEEGDYRLRFLVGVEGKGTCHLELVDIDEKFDKLNIKIRKYLMKQ